MTLKESLRFKDRLIKGISQEGYFRISAIKTTEVVRAAQERHNLSLLNTVLLGRTLTASMLLASELKGEERLTLKLEGNGIVGMLMAEANRAGEIRGYSQHPDAELDPAMPDTSIGDGLGIGVLTVSKILYNEAEPQISTIQLHKGDVVTDVAHYLAQSEQIPSAILLDVRLSDSGEVMQAGGLMVQKLPGAPDHVVSELQDRLRTFDRISDLLDQGIYIDDIMQKAVKPFEIQEMNRQPVHFFCRCNRDRFLSALSLLSYDDLKEMEGESQEMVCHFCNNRIKVSRNEIHDLVVSAHAKMN
ncbi:MAG: Hsp33 family molecular chaperone HslO [Balneolaceae bacterium]